MTRPVDLLQNRIMETMRNTSIDPQTAMNVMLSIALSIAKEVDKEPIARINKELEELQFWQYGKAKGAD